MFLGLIHSFVLEHIDETEASLLKTDARLEGILPALSTYPERAEQIEETMQEITEHIEKYKSNIESMLNNPLIQLILWFNTLLPWDNPKLREINDALERLDGLPLMAAQMTEKVRKWRNRGKKAGPPRAAPWG